jgi:phage terminase small subunit
MPLNDNQRRFIAYYRATTPRHATRAYEAVYTLRGEPARVAASRLLTNVNVRAAIDAADAEELRDLGLTPARVLREIARLGFSDVRQLYDEAGNLKAPHELDDDLAAAIAAVEVVSYVTQETDAPLLTRTHKIRLWNKSENLRLLAQYLHLLVEKVEVTVSGEVLHTWSARLSTAHTSLEERRNGHAHAP